MSVGFGFSAGDFIAALKLVGTVIDALRESSHASSSFRSLLNELYTLESALLCIKRLDLDHRHDAGELALRQAASQCQRTIDAFWKDAQKYQPHLHNGTDSHIKDGWAKVKWAVCKKSDLETFRAQIRGHTSSIELLLMRVQMEAATIDAREQNVHNKSLARIIRELSSQVRERLVAIAGSVGQCAQQGKTLLETSAQIIQTNLRIFQLVRDTHLLLLRIPGQVQRQQPVYLVDAFNRECPFHLEFVRSAEALLAVLKDNIRLSGCDPGMIDRGEFAIEEAGTRNSISLDEPWDRCFFPGQRVAMSMVFQYRPTPTSSCPRCGTEREGSATQEITCAGCGIIFRRVEEVIDNLQSIVQAFCSVDKSDSGYVLETPSNGPGRSQTKRKCEEADVRTQVQKFRRIQLLTRDVMFVCSICKETFRRRTGFRRHIEAAHTPTVRIKCRYCSYACYGWNKLNLHELIFHGLVS